MDGSSAVEAGEEWSGLLDRVLAGENVVLTRSGQPVAELRPLHRSGQPVTAADLDWLATHRVGTRPATTDAGSLVSRMRDEDWP